MVEQIELNVFEALSKYKKIYFKKASVMQYIPEIDCLINVGNLDIITVSKIVKALVVLYGEDIEKYHKQLKELVYERFYFFQKLQENFHSSKLESKESKKRKSKTLEEEEDGKMKKKAKRGKSLEVSKEKKPAVSKEIKLDVSKEIKLDVSKEKKPVVKKEKKPVVRKEKKPAVKKEDQDLPISGTIVSSTEIQSKHAKKGGIATSPVSISELLVKIIGKAQPSSGESWTRTKVIQAIWNFIKIHQLQNPENKKEILFKKNPDFASLFPADLTSVDMFSMQKYISAHIKSQKI